MSFVMESIMYYAEKDKIDNLLNGKVTDSVSYVNVRLPKMKVYDFFWMTLCESTKYRGIGETTEFIENFRDYFKSFYSKKTENTLLRKIGCKVFKHSPVRWILYKLHILKFTWDKLIKIDRPVYQFYNNKKGVSLFFVFGDDTPIQLRNTKE